MKRTAKGLMALLLAGAMMASLAACGSQAGTTDDEAGTQAESVTEEISTAESGSTQEDEVTGTMDGGYEVNSGSMAIDDNEDAKAAFEKATGALDGSEYEPIALLGTQIVAGTNYAVLCRITAVTPDAEPELGIVYIYEDLEGNCEVSEVKDLEF